MAAIGMQYIVAAPFAENQTEGALPVYGNGMILGRAVSASFTWRRNDAELYADDALAENDNAILGGDLDMTVAELLDDVYVALFGATKDETTSDYHDSDQASPYIGVGYMRVQRYKGETTYKTYWYYKAQLSPAEEADQTRGETTSFQTQRVTGKVMAANDATTGKNRFRAWHTHKTKAEAVAWLNKMGNYTPAAA